MQKIKEAKMYHPPTTSRSLLECIVYAIANHRPWHLVRVDVFAGKGIILIQIGI